MTTRLDRPIHQTDPVVTGAAVLAVVATAIGVLLLLRAELGGRVDHRTVQVDNLSGLPLQVEVVGPRGGAVALGQVAPRGQQRVDAVPDQGSTWTFVATYGGREVYRESVARAELAADGWTVRIPAAATAALERAGYR